MSRLQQLKFVFLLFVAGLFISPAKADIVQNGGFELTTHGAGQLGNNTDAIDWFTSARYAYLYTSAAQAQVGSNGRYGVVALWGPNNGSSNGFTDSPLGGNFIAADAALGQSPLTQTINGLIVGDKYQISFDWAVAQEYGYSGATNAQWEVSLGGVTQNTPLVGISSHGFSGWQQETFTYTATSASEVLSFLANGSGLPPFALLDGLTVTPVPEPGSWMIFFAIAGSMGLYFARKFRNSAKA